jgi:hypothetical protein
MRFSARSHRGGGVLIFYAVTQRGFNVPAALSFALAMSQ